MTVEELNSELERYLNFRDMLKELPGQILEASFDNKDGSISSRLILPRADVYQGNLARVFDLLLYIPEFNALNTLKGWDMFFRCHWEAPKAKAKSAKGRQIATSSRANRRLAKALIIELVWLKLGPLSGPEKMSKLITNRFTKMDKYKPDIE